MDKVILKERFLFEHAVAILTEYQEPFDIDSLSCYIKDIIKEKEDNDRSN